MEIILDNFHEENDLSLRTPENVHFVPFCCRPAAEGK